MRRRSGRFPDIRPGVDKAWRRIAERAAFRTARSGGVVPANGLAAQRAGGAIRDPILARVEAVLLASDEPIKPRQLAKLADLPDTGEVRRQVERLNHAYQQCHSAFAVAELAGGYQLLTDPELRPWLDQVLRFGQELQLSGPALETLAIIAYRQPICRADIEAIRGVQIGEVLKQLLDRGLARLVGKDDSLGRPFLYGTTKLFLEVFGLRSLSELPLVELLATPAAGAVAAASEPNPPDLADADDPEEEA